MDLVFGLIRSKNWAELIISRNLVVSAKFNHKFVPLLTCNLFKAVLSVVS